MNRNGHLVIAIGLLLLSTGPALRAEVLPHYLVTSDLPTGDAGIYRLADLNGDGDALDVGERLLWGDGMVQAADVRRFGPHAVMAADPPRGQLVLFQDINRDGDALDAGEAVVWADGLGSVFGFDVRGDRVLAADFANHVIYQLADANGDGDALDVGERVLWSDGVDSPVGVRYHGSGAVATSFSGGDVHRLLDVNGDGDALDVGERLSFTPTGAMNGPAGLFARDDVLFVTELVGDQVNTAVDGNGDGDAMDVIELLSYSDEVFGQLDGPWNMTEYHLGGLLVVENDGHRVSLQRDINGDGDALDFGEVTLWADGLQSPIGITFVPEPATWFVWLLLPIVAASRWGRERA